MGTNSAPLLSDHFFYSYEAEFIQKLIPKKLKNTETIAAKTHTLVHHCLPR